LRPFDLEGGTVRADAHDMETQRLRAHGHPLRYVAAAVVAAAVLEAVGVLIYSVLLPLTG
jgi:hypothetical protein